MVKEDCPYRPRMEIWGFNVFLVLAEVGTRTECSTAVEAKSALGTMTSNRNKEFRRGER